MSLLDGLRLATGTLTVLPVGAPRRVTRTLAGYAMLLAPVAVIPLGVLIALLAWAGIELLLSPLAVAAVCVGALALGSRAFHLDGLADTADGLAASYDRERSLQVMKSGNTGPAGVAIIVIVLGIQIASLAAVITRPWGWVLAGILVCLSRAALSITCMMRVPAARPDGLGVTYTQTIPVVIAIAQWLAVGVLTAAAFTIADLPWWHGLIAAAVAVLVVVALVHRSVKRFGGVTGDTFGAAIELTLATLLLAAT